MLWMCKLLCFQPKTINIALYDMNMMEARWMLHLTMTVDNVNQRQRYQRWRVGRQTLEVHNLLIHTRNKMSLHFSIHIGLTAITNLHHELLPSNWRWTSFPFLIASFESRQINLEMTHRTSEFTSPLYWEIIKNGKNPEFNLSTLSLHPLNTLECWLPKL